MALGFAWSGICLQLYCMMSVNLFELEHSCNSPHWVWLYDAAPPSPFLHLLTRAEASTSRGVTRQSSHCLNIWFDARSRFRFGLSFPCRGAGWLYERACEDNIRPPNRRLLCRKRLANRSPFFMYVEHPEEDRSLRKDRSSSVTSSGNDRNS